MLFISATELADRFGVSYVTITKYLKAGLIYPAVKISNSWVIQANFMVSPELMHMMVGKRERTGRAGRISGIPDVYVRARKPRRIRVDGVLVERQPPKYRRSYPLPTSKKRRTHFLAQAEERKELQSMSKKAQKESRQSPCSS